jgi:hypothetical protein
LGSAFNFGLLIFLLNDKYCEIWTQHLAELTVNAGFLVLDARRMIALGVELLCHLQNILGTILHAEPAPLAAILDDVNLPPRDLDLIAVQGPPPVFHLLPLTNRSFSDPGKKKPIVSFYPITLALSRLFSELTDNSQGHS